MRQLGNGLSDARHHEDALSVKGAELSMARRLGAAEEDLLVVQSNLAGTYRALGRLEEALRMRQNLYSECVRINGEESRETLVEAVCYANALIVSRRFNDAKALMRQTLPVARRVLGNMHEYTLRMRSNYARALCEDDSATLEDLRESVETLEDVERIARRVFGSEHPRLQFIERHLRNARAALHARETADTPPKDA